MNNKTKCLCSINISRKIFVEFANLCLRTPKGLNSYWHFLCCSVSAYVPFTNKMDFKQCVVIMGTISLVLLRNYYYFNENFFFFFFTFLGITSYFVASKSWKVECTW